MVIDLTVIFKKYVFTSDVELVWFKAYWRMPAGIEWVDLFSETTANNALNMVTRKPHK